MSMPVKTAKVEGRRTLDYGSLEEMMADADRLASTTVKVLGNWSEGQIFRHLAIAFNGSIDGYTRPFPWPLRMIGKTFKKKLMNGPMPAGIKLPFVVAEILVPEPTSTADGLTELRTAVERLRHESRRAKHPMFGELSRDEWNTFHLKHANLHMSFLVPLS